MKILNLTLQNFKGIRNLDLNTQGKDANIFGDNAAGKTTLSDAFMWLLFDKDSQNRKDFQIKTLLPNGEPEHGLNHSVEAFLQLEDGSQLALKKVYYEKWTKKRGSATAEFTGHTTDYFIDGVPAQKKEYDAKIAEIADENIFRLLTDPRYFNEQLHWTDRRKLLLEVCGDVSDSEVIASNPDLSKLSEILGKRTIEQHRKVIQAHRTEINRELEKIPVRIDEVQLGLPRIDDITNPEALPDDIEKLRDELRAKQEELAQARAGGQVAEKIKELRTIEGQILDLKNRHRQETDKKVGEKRIEQTKLVNKIALLKADIESHNRSIRFNENEIKSLEEKMESLRKKWREVNTELFEFEQDTTCPTCRQALPAEQIEAAREKALAQFNQAKAEKLEEINAAGVRFKETKTSTEESISLTRQELEKAEKELAKLEQKEAALKTEIDSIMQGAEPVESTPEFYELNAKHRDLQEEIQKLNADSSLAIAKIQKEVDEMADAIKALNRAQVRLEERESGLKRIEDLKAEERKLAKEFEELEYELYLTDEFVRSKVRLLEDRINSKFKMARFKLFNVLVNGGIEECCETVYNGVPYSNLNNGARLNIGLDIINTLSDHYGFAPPVWLDNAESVTDILPTKGQQIRLIVSGKDKKLRVELAEREALKEVV